MATSVIRQLTGSPFHYQSSGRGPHTTPCKEFTASRDIICVFFCVTEFALWKQLTTELYTITLFIQQCILYGC